MTSGQSGTRSRISGTAAVRTQASDELAKLGVALQGVSRKFLFKNLPDLFEVLRDCSDEANSFNHSGNVLAFGVVTFVEVVEVDVGCIARICRA